MGKIIKAEKRGGGGIESKVIEEYTPLHSHPFIFIIHSNCGCFANHFCQPFA